MKPSALEVKRIRAQEAQADTLSALQVQLSEVEEKLDQIMLALKIGQVDVQPPPEKPAAPKAAK